MTDTHVRELTALTAGGSSEAEMATPTNDPVLPPSIESATPAPDGRAINTPTHRLRPRPLPQTNCTVKYSQKMCPRGKVLGLDDPRGETPWPWPQGLGALTLALEIKSLITTLNTD